MIKKFIHRLLGKGAPPADPPAPPAPPAIPLGQRVELPVSEHRIDPGLLDANAVRVVRTLKEAGHEAYIVGGAVRDLMVGLRPKDFDVATDATPEQVKALFRRAFIIGRRFRIVHVVFGRGREHETIEVSTFRAYMDTSAAEQVAGNEKTSKAALAEIPTSTTWSTPAPSAARQRVGSADRGRGAARLHDQCDVLRPADADRGRLPRGPGRMRARACCA